MSDITPGLQTYNTAFPFDVSFHNQFQNEGLAVLYIVNSIDATKPEQKVRIHINPTTDQSYTFKGLGAQQPDAASFNLALALRPGILKSEVDSSFSKMLETSLNNTLQASKNSCSVQGPVTRTSDGALIWYCAFASDLTLDTSGISFLLEGISAEAGTGSRSTQVEFLFANVLPGNDTHSFSFKRSLHVDIINHLGHAHAPMHFGVVGKNVLLNEPGHDNELQVYFQTDGRVPLEFGSQTEIDFTFSYDTDASELIHFGSQSEVKAYSLADSASPAPVFTGGDAVDNKNGLMTIKAYGFGTQSLVTCIFHFSTIQISGPDGQTVLTITIRNLPGYWDTTFQVPVIKEASTLTSELELGPASTKGHLGTGSRIDFLSGLNDKNGLANVSIEESWGLNLYGTPAETAAPSAQGVPTRQANPPWPGQPVKVRNADFLVPEGRVAINGGTDYPKPESGNTNPNEKLNVAGDTYLAGHVGIKGDVGITGAEGDHQLTIVGEGNNRSGIMLCPPFNGNSSPAFGWLINVDSGPTLSIYGPSGTDTYKSAIVLLADTINLSTRSGKPTSLNVNGPVSTTDRYQDKTGDVMPVGSIMAFGGKTPPAGWLLCDGSTIPSQYDDLIKVVGATNTPNLCGRALIGTGAPNNNRQSDGTTPNFTGQNWPVGYTGGEAQHTLSVNEMPGHNHQQNYANEMSADQGWPAAGFKAVYATDRANKTGGSLAMQNTGGNQPHNNLPPYYAVNYIIKC